MIVRELLVKLGVIADPAKVKDFDTAIEDLKANMGALVGVAKQAVAVGAALGTALGVQAVATAHTTIEIERQAAALGLSTDAYQEWAATVGTFGTDAKDLADGFGQVAQVIGDAQSGASNAVDTFKAINIQVKDLKGKSIEEVFYLIADGLKQTTDSGDRLRAANVLLGEQLARQLLPLLIQGSEGLDRYRREARELGAVLDVSAIQRGRDAAENFARFGFVVQGLRNEIGLAFLPVMTQLANVFAEFMAENRVAVGARIAAVVADIQDAIDALAVAVYRVDALVEESFGGWANTLQRVKTLVTLLAAAQGWRLLIGSITAVRAAFVALTGAGGLLAGASLSTVLGWAVALAAALVALYLVVDDLWTYWRGGESVIGNVIAGSERTRVTLAALGEAGRALGAVLSAAWDAIRMGVKVLMPVLGPLFEVLSELLSGPAEGLFKMFGNQLLASIRAFARTMEFAASAIQTVVTALSYLWAMMEGRANLGDALSAVGSDAGKTIGALGRAVGQGALALPFLGSMTGGGKSASGGGVYVPATAPTTVPTSAPAPSVTTTNSVAGNTNYFYGLSTRDIEELQYRENLMQSRQLLALSGTGS